MHVQGARWFGPLFDRWIALVVHTSVQVPVEDDLFGGIFKFWLS
jgi:hypothetical protein